MDTLPSEMQRTYLMEMVDCWTVRCSHVFLLGELHFGWHSLNQSLMSLAMLKMYRNELFIIPDRITTYCSHLHTSGTSQYRWLQSHRGDQRLEHMRARVRSLSSNAHTWDYRSVRETWLLDSRKRTSAPAQSSSLNPTPLMISLTCSTTDGSTSLLRRKSPATSVTLPEILYFQSSTSCSNAASSMTNVSLMPWKCHWHPHHLVTWNLFVQMTRYNTHLLPCDPQSHTPHAFHVLPVMGCVIPVHPTLDEQDGVLYER